jgi:hypothetical protein
MEFRISEDRYKTIVKKRTRVLVPIMSVFILAIILINLHTAQIDQWLPIAVIVPLVMAYVGFGLYRNLRKQTRLILSYSLTVTDSEIIREQQNVPTLTISFMEVKEIIKTRKGGFMIKGRTSVDVIHVPSLIDDIATLEQRLETFAPITVVSRDPRQYQGLLYLVGLAALITSNTVSNIFIAVPAGLIAMGMLIWLFITVRRSKNVTVAARRKSWLYLVFAAFVAFSVYSRFLMWR